MQHLKITTNANFVISRFPISFGWMPFSESIETAKLEF